MRKTRRLEPPEEKQPVPDVSSAHGARILLVDDHADTLLTMARLLERRGYLDTPACSMTAAIEAGANHAFDLLISDIGLPDGSGLKLPGALAEFQQLPSIAMSGFGTESDLVRSKEAGFSEHLTKPINVEQLVGQIERLVRRPAEGLVLRA